MPRAKYKPTDFTIDKTSFSDAIDSYVAGRPTIDNPTIQDYYMHYGSNSSIANQLVKQGYYSNYNSAMRQVQRLMKDPDKRITRKTQEALGSLGVGNKPLTITITGYASYTADGSTGFRPMKFSHTVTASEASKIIQDTRLLGNQQGIDRFMDIYIGGRLSFVFLADGLTVQVSS